MSTVPWAEPAERAVLGAVLESPRALANVRRVLDADQFYRPAHQAVYRAAVAVADGGHHVDAVAVADELERRGELSRTGGHPYLVELVQDAAPTPDAAAHDAGIVRRKAEHRRALETARRAVQRLETEDVDPADALDRMRGELDQVTTAAPAAAPWQPVDLGPILRGEVKRPSPTVGVARNDGLRTLYPGKEHAVIGETESGKSWYALASAAAELVNGNHVVYVHFEESDATDTVERLRALDVPADVILDRFRFIPPDRPASPAALDTLLDPVPTLVIFDGVNEGMSLHGHAIREEDGVAAFRRLLVNPCTAAGAAVLECDHVVKDREARGRYALGSIHKANALSGALIVLEGAEPFGCGRRGASHVFVTKDRPGHLRRHGKATRTSGKTYLGTLVVDDEPDWLDFAFLAPSEDTEDQSGPPDKHSETDEHVLDVVRTLTQGGELATGRAIRAKSRYGTDPTLDALERLVLDGKLTKSTGPRNSRIYEVAS